jgi:hypothetical protein
MPSKMPNKKRATPKAQKHSNNNSNNSNNTAANKQHKNKKPRTPKSKRVAKIIQGGGYYNPVPDTGLGQVETQSGGVMLSGNMLMYVIIGLLLVIGVLVYMNIKQSEKTGRVQLDNAINNELLQEAEILKNNKAKAKANIGNNKKEDYHSSLNAHPQYSAGHRLVGPDADNAHEISIMGRVLDHNVERLINPLLPPERSYVNTYGIPTNIPSRGFSGGYQQVGSLSKTEVTNEDTQPGNNNKSVILPLFGQPTYPGSNKWNYYTTTDKHAMVKMTFKVGGKDSDDRHGVNELMTGDQIQIPEYNGNFDVKVYQFDQPRYIPFVY